MLCLQQARRQLGLDNDLFIYNSMEAGVQRVTSVGLLIGNWERERESGVASLGLVPAKSSFGGFSLLSIGKLGRLAFESTQTNRIIAHIFGSIYCS